MMTGITPEVLAKLQAPFPIDAHELRDGGRDGKLVYLTEEPLIDRLIDVDPNWEFRIVSTTITDYNLTRPDSATVAAELTICGITRGGVGCCVANITKWEYVDGKRKELAIPIINPLSETEIKGAATDALKRCARQFGVGGYLLRTKGEKFQNEQDFARWYAREFVNGAQSAPHTRVQPPEASPRNAGNNGTATTTPQVPQNAPQNAMAHNGDDFPTVKRLWGHVSSDLLKRKVADLPENVNIGGIIYPVAKSVLGYADENAVKAAMELNSLTEWQNTVEALMVRVIDKSPAVAA